MKTKIILIAVITIISISCGNTPINKKENKVVNILLSTTIKEITKDSLYSLNDEYFICNLTQGKVKGENGYFADYEIESSSVGKEFKFVYLSIVNESKQTICFKTPSDFLNYMSESGYELNSQIKNKYTFRRKIL
jgi:hypothetical protein